MTDEERGRADTDGVLEWLAKLANKVEGPSIAITLMFGGTLVTGKLIGHEEYFSRVGDLWSRGFPSPEQREAIDRFWTSQGRPEPGEDDVESKPLRYIHLADAHVVAGPAGLIPSGKGILWRGRISGIDGFFFEALGVGPTSSGGRT